MVPLRIRLIAALSALTAVAGCAMRRAVPPAATPEKTTVFTDSTLHNHLCEPNRPGEDWHHVCTPRDQSVGPVLRGPVPRTTDTLKILKP